MPPMDNAKTSEVHYSQRPIWVRGVVHDPQNWEKGLQTHSAAEKAADIQSKALKKAAKAARQAQATREAVDEEAADHRAAMQELEHSLSKWKPYK